MEFLGSVWRWFSDPTHWGGSDGIPRRLIEHVQLSAESVAIGALIALPIGIALGHYGRFGNLAFQIFGLGDFPIVLSLTALAIPPMLTNSYVAVREVDPDVKDAARGMGFRDLAQLLRVELPLAVPLIMAGTVSYTH